MRPIALDTNVLIYFEGLDDERRGEAARLTIERFQARPIVVPAQAILELTRALQLKFRWSSDQVREAILTWRNLAEVGFADEAALNDAMALALDNRLQVFDAVILATAAAGNCALLLSEDMQDGFTWRGCTVVNPFAAKLHPKLTKALAGED
jgi:predicted nucleic acid-binding protein